MSYKTIWNNLTPCQQLAVTRHIAELNNDIVNEPLFEASDNDRIARKSHPDEVAWYEERQAAGCCGSYDVELDTPDGVILLGWCYGH